FFLLTGSLLLGVTQAQTGHSRRKEDFDVYKFDAVAIDITPRSSLIQLNNLQGITVMDVRADTARIGLMQKRIVDHFTGLLSNATKKQTEQRLNRTPTFVTMRDGLQREATAFLEKAIKFPGNPNLPGILMVIKKLWLSDEQPYRQQIGNGGGLQSQIKKDAWTSGIDLSVEFYLKSGTDYYPLYRYDSVICEAMTVSEHATEFVEEALRVSIQKLQQMDAIAAAILRRRTFSLAAINQHNRDAFNIPALTDTVLRAGVYLDFDEFKNNNPSLGDFMLQKDRLTDILYVRHPDGSEFVARNVWGYCDGSHAYVQAGDNFFLLQRMENAFYIFGAKKISRNETATSGAAAYQGKDNGFAAPYYYTRSGAAIQLEPFQLDWYSGNLY
ncbi:MAG: hypothetical protein ABI813_05125, partial [Bacteroidota bacterium]